MASGAAARRALARWREWVAAWWRPPRIDFLRRYGVIDHASAGLRERRKAQEDVRGRGGAFEWFASMPRRRLRVTCLLLHSAQRINGRPRSAMIWSHDPPSRSSLSLLLAARAAQYDTMIKLYFCLSQGIFVRPRGPPMKYCNSNDPLLAT
jgi:hypothetical protein